MAMEELNQVPPFMVGGVANLPDLIVALATLKGASRSSADRVVDVLPAKVRAVPCFLDRLTKRWRYVYGDPFVGLPDGKVVFGTHMYPEVDRLFDVISCAQRRLPSSALPTYLAAVGDPMKHEAALAEFAPILRLNSAVDVDYEVPGDGAATIDWLIRAPGERNLLLEVKHRVKDLLEAFCQLQVSAEDTSPEPVHDPNLLFRSVEQKFPRRETSKAVQGVWINTGLRQEEKEFQRAFRKLDPQRVHVAILGDWGDDAYVMAHDDTRHFVTRVLGIRESRRFVFRRGVPVEM